MTEVALLGMLALLMAVLAWVAWRYFAALPPLPAPTGRGHQALRRARQPNRGNGLTLLRHRAVTAALVCVALGVATPVALERHVDPGPLILQAFQGGERVHRNLHPEQLVPPPPLPPSLFAATERPDLESADRDWAKLDPSFSRRLLLLLARLEAQGYPFALVEGYRSPERQERLAALGPQVTLAGAMQSRHQFGLAADLAPLQNGRLALSEREPWAWRAYQALGVEAEALGLTWGGRWTLRDYGHVEMTPPKPPGAFLRNGCPSLEPSPCRPT